MGGYVNDLDPGARKGLTARDPDDMIAWNSIVGHHMGLTHVMKSFTKSIKKRIDEEVHDVYRHGIVHGSVVNFVNVVVATKAWNLLYSVVGWAQSPRSQSRRSQSHLSSPAGTFDFGSTATNLSHGPSIPMYRSSYPILPLLPPPPSLRRGAMGVGDSSHRSFRRHGVAASPKDKQPRRAKDIYGAYRIGTTPARTGPSSGHYANRAGKSS